MLYVSRLSCPDWIILDNANIGIPTSLRCFFEVLIWQLTLKRVLSSNIEHTPSSLVDHFDPPTILAGCTIDHPHAVLFPRSQSQTQGLWPTIRSKFTPGFISSSKSDSPTDRFGMSTPTIGHALSLPPTSTHVCSAHERLNRAITQNSNMVTLPYILSYMTILLTVGFGLWNPCTASQIIFASP